MKRYLAIFGFVFIGVIAGLIVRGIPIVLQVQAGGGLPGHQVANEPPILDHRRRLRSRCLFRSCSFGLPVKTVFRGALIAHPGFLIWTLH